MRRIRIKAEWDDEAGVYVATSDDVPGLVTEAETFEGLIERVVAVLPELLQANGFDAQIPPIQVMAERLVKVA